MHDLSVLAGIVRDQDGWDYEAIAKVVGACEPIRASLATIPVAEETDTTGPPGHRQQQTRLNEECKSAVVREYLAGAKASDIALRFNVHRTTVTRIVRDAGHKVRRTGILTHEISDAIQRYESGASLATIGKALSVDHGTVRNTLLKHGVAMRDTHGRARS